MSVAGLGQISHCGNARHFAHGVHGQAIHLVCGIIFSVRIGTTDNIDVAQGFHGTHAPARLGQGDGKLFPCADGAVVIERSGIDLVAHAFITVTAYHDQMVLCGYYRHTCQGYRHGIKFGPTRNAIVLLRGAIHIAHNIGTIEAT